MSKSRVLLVTLLGLAFAGFVGGLLYFRRTQSLPYRLEQLRGEAEIQQRLGELELAIAALRKVMELDPNDRETPLRVARLQLALGRLEDGEALLRECLAERPGHVPTILALGRLLLDQDRIPETARLLLPHLDAIGEFHDVAERSEGLILAGMTYARLGEDQRGVALLEKAAELRETYGLRKLDTGDARAAALLALGTVHQNGRRWREAERALEEARAIAADGVQIHVRLAQVYARTNRVDEGVALLSGFCEAQAEDLAVIAPVVADFYISVARFGEAEQLAATLEGKGDQAQAAYVRGAVSLARGDAKRAREAFQSMSRLAPRSVASRLLLARAADAAGDAAGATEAYQAALALRPGDAEAELGLLELEERTGQYGEAKERALRLLGDPRTRPQASLVLLAAFVRDRDAATPLTRADQLLKRYPGDASLGMFAAVLRLLSGDTERGAAELASLGEVPGVDLSGALGLLAEAQNRRSDAHEVIELLADIAARDPRLSPARLVLAGIYERLGRVDLALQQLDQALAARPDDAEARRARLRLALRMGDLEAAVAQAEALREADPENPELTENLGALRLRQGEVMDALNLLRQAISLAPKSARAHARLARAWYRAGDLPAARTTYGTAQELDPKLPAAYEEGVLLLQEGDVAAARQVLERGADATGDPALAAACGVALALQGEPAQALRRLEAWRSRGPELFVLRAYLVAGAGNRPAAASFLEGLAGAIPRSVREEALDLPSEEAASFLTLFALATAGWLPELEAKARAVAERSGASATLSWFAWRALEPGDPQRLVLARRLAGHEQADAGAGLLLARSLEEADQEDEALRTLRSLVEQFPDDPQVALRLGMSLESSGNTKGALLLYSRAVASGANTGIEPIALNNMAYLLGANRGQVSAALEQARRAVRLEPRLPQPHDTLGWLLFLDGRVAEAERELSRAVGMNPASPTARYHFARALEARGALPRAANNLRIALLTTQPFPDRQDAERRLRRLEQTVALLATEDARELGIGSPLELTTGEAGGAAARIAPSASGRLVRLELTSPGVAAEVVITDAAGGIYKRLPVPAGGRSVLARFVLQGAGHRVAVMTGEAGATVRLAIDEEAPKHPFEVEPNDEPAQGREVGESAVSGRFDSAGDLDHFGLELTSSKALEVKAGARASVRAELFDAAAPRLRKAFEVPAGATVSVDALEGSLILRLAPASALEGAADHDYSVRVRAVEGVARDREPNDGIPDALLLELGKESKGALGPGDAQDWYRLEGDGGALVSIALTCTPGTQLQVWERSRGAAFPRAVYTGEGEGVRVERWRLPPSGVLMLAVITESAGAGPVDYAYTLSATAAAADDAREVEPNDYSEEAMPLAASLSGEVGGSDRDLVRVKEGQSVSVKATGEEPVVVRWAGPATSPRVVSPGQEATMPPAPAEPDGALLVITAPAGQGRVSGYELIAK